MRGRRKWGRYDDIMVDFALFCCVFRVFLKNEIPFDLDSDSSWRIKMNDWGGPTLSVKITYGFDTEDGLKVKIFRLDILIEIMRNSLVLSAVDFHQRTKWMYKRARRPRAEDFRSRVSFAHVLTHIGCRKLRDNAATMTAFCGLYSSIRT